MTKVLHSTFKSSFRIFLAGLVCSFFSFSASAQGFKPDGYSFSLKGGFYDDINAGAGIAGGYELSLRNKGFQYTLDYISAGEIIGGKSPDERFRQINLLFGKSIDFQQDKVRYIYQAGLSAFWGFERGDLISQSLVPEEPIYNTNYYESDKFFTAGLVMKFEAQFLATKWVSLGASLETNINPKKIIYMPMLNLQIGKIRPSYRQKKTN